MSSQLMQSNELIVKFSEEYLWLFQDIIEKATKQAIDNMKSEEKMETVWMTQKEACSWANISYNTLQSWRKNGLKISVVEGKTLVSKIVIHTFIKKHEL